MKKLAFQFIVVLAIAITVNLALQHIADQRYEAEKQQNLCPYEGLECPNAQAVMDSLNTEIIALKTQLAGCEFQDHSKLVETFTVVTVDTTIPNWREHAMLLKY